MKTVSLFSALSLVVVAACHRDQPKERPGTISQEQRSSPDEQDKSGVSTTTVTGASYVGNDSAIDRIVGARCARESICANVGADKHFASSGACLREVRTKMSEDLQASQCPGGIDGKELDECVTAIEREDCNNLVEMITRLAQCQKGQLCLKANAPQQGL